MRAFKILQVLAGSVLLALLIVGVLTVKGNGQSDPSIGNVRITWQPNTEPNLIGYRVYLKPGIAYASTAESGLIYCGPGDASCCVWDTTYTKGESKTWGVVAVDLGGQESAKTDISLSSLVGDPPSAPAGVALELLPDTP